MVLKGISPAQILRSFFWTFGSSITVYVLLTILSKHSPRLRRKCRLDFACRLWTSTSLGFFTGFLKEVLDAIPGVAWPWCGPQSTLENPCQFQWRVVLVYYESAVVAMIVLIVAAMIRTCLRKRRFDLSPPCDETVAESVDEDLFDNDEEAGSNQKPPNDVDERYAGTENSESSIADDSLHLHSEGYSCSEERSTCSSPHPTMVKVKVVSAAVPLYSNEENVHHLDEEEEEEEPAGASSSYVVDDSLMVNAEEGVISSAASNSSSDDDSVITLMPMTGLEKMLRHIMDEEEPHHHGCSSV